MLCPGARVKRARAWTFFAKALARELRP